MIGLCPPKYGVLWSSISEKMAVKRDARKKWLPKLVINKITFKRTWSLSNAVCFKYVKYLTTNTAKVGHVTPSRPPLT